MTAAEKTAVVIEDDRDVRELVVMVLRQAGFVSHPAADGFEGLRLAREHHPLLVTVDVGLPDIDGFEVNRRLRAHTDAYIMMITAWTEEQDIVFGFATGADAYLAKPFLPRELRLRVDALLRRPRKAYIRGRHLVMENLAQPVSPPGSGSGRLRHDGLELHADTREVLVDGREISLSRSEYELLRAIMRGGRLVQTRENLALALPAAASVPRGRVLTADLRAVEAHVGNLRRKLGDHPRHPRWIQTVRGVGYRLVSDASPAS